jgi:S-adenosylmethionine/arginine decarboxylase-like enzyme
MDGPAAVSKLWPASQLLITADTSDAADALLHPRRQLQFLDEFTTFAGPNIFADSLVYSTPHGNTGWTAFRMGELGHVSFHHWDTARPGLLQLDVQGAGQIDGRQAMAVVSEFWAPLGLRAVVIRRGDPSHALERVELRDDLVPRPGIQPGLGPGDHLHLLIDQKGSLRSPFLNPSRLDEALAELVSIIRMRNLTSVRSHHDHQGTNFSYSSIVGITTSHICLRICQMGRHASLSLDLFSCRNFDAQSVFGWLQQLMPSPESRRAVLYTRYPKGEFVTIQ